MPNQPNGSEPAFALFKTSIEKATAQTLSLAELFDAAARLKAARQERFVAELYKTWIAFNSDHPLIYAAYFNYASALGDSGDRPGGINALREALRVKSDFHPAHINLGRLLEDSGQAGKGVAQWMVCVEQLGAITGDSVSHKLSALQQIGRVLEGHDKDESAEDALRQSLEIDPRQTEVAQHWIALRQRQCEWPVLAATERVSRKHLLDGISSLSLANLADDPMFQLAKAYRYNRRSIGRIPPLPREEPPRRRPGERLRIGYVSSDLREHAVGFAMTDVMETHDRAHFEIHAYYCGIARTDPTRERIAAAVDRWTEINGMSDEEAARKIADDGVHILIDLNGYTKDARTKMFAMRPAPIVVNWFGFPGTMGTPYHHYVIADSIIVPEDAEIYYSEKVLRLPCYQPNDRKRVVAAERPSRQEAGLPESAFVFCSLNGMQKLTALTFDRWMTILAAVPDSVLWLLTGTQATNERIRAAASARGVAPERIVFAQKMPNPRHLARYPLADLFLDNFPYGAHTTAADSLWMGVPILTFPGRSFASRVCASLVRAAGVEELVCADAEDYVARAIELGRNPRQLAAIRDKLVAGRDRCALFDTPALVGHLENLYREMWRDYEAGALPRPDLRNLDLYHEIGLELDHERLELLDDNAYRALYLDKLAQWDRAEPIAPDERFWRAR
ncbi:MULTISPECIES: O-linked N-acetylglucosamine transferase family protein [Methylosinus]|uniref:protein O-GlcNAc transferase n=1 Tax=Methylosinus trichosporium (strain ATCC 35070 / NCIMB 11131 / UNIQEM 75 / OB3b) TaxID=595536 RepID=A0A2D2D595_METT3|nr:MULTISPECIES: glycosyl transferase [Methylosinus]ATQ70132.1 glycosyl transferase [Methylosinus trichosporium OB3b]OBS54381.1 glycosyl transferase [Methylosinus sp. 3S-1]